MQTKEQVEARIQQLRSMRTQFIADLYSTKERVKNLSRNIHAVNGALDEAGRFLKSITGANDGD